MILDVPTPDHIESLVSAFSTPAYSPFREGHVVHVIYHLLGSNVLEDDRYKSFMDGFGDDTQHLICSPDHNPDPLTFTSAGLSQLRLNQLDSEMFPLPYYRTTPRKDLSCALLFFNHLTVSLIHVHFASGYPASAPMFIFTS
jgi:ribonuclease Z